MAVVLRKLFGIGKLPDDLREAVTAEGIIHLAEYVAVTRHFSGKVPGLRSAGSVSSYSGSLVFTSQRVLATLSSVPKLAGRVIDQRWLNSSNTATDRFQYGYDADGNVLYKPGRVRRQHRE